MYIAFLRNFMSIYNFSKMEQDITLKAFLTEILEPIIDDCVTRAMNKYINTMKYDQPPEVAVFDITAAAKYLSLSKSTLYQHSFQRRIPHYKQGKRIYFRKDDLDQWITKGRVKTHEEIEAEADAYIARKSYKH